ncbi:hypothetical protein FED29_017815 [Aeromonas veronii]|jgi:hypothetical protein|uniref:hypothetical protein n=1 Tax=Aeromonas dhakensis TaxID=196024 RepID=UPI0011EEE7EA|nr:hypothetical protein [Aeromonas dhakensis]MBO0505284.1 hypothetical protein [Aeromonas veronii]
MSDNIVWSVDEDGASGWEHEIGDLILSHSELEPGRVVFRGVCSPFTGFDLVSGDDIAEMAAERAWDELGEIGENWDYSKEAIAELDSLITGWLGKHNPTGYQFVEMVTEYTLTKADFEEAGA